VNSEGAQIHVAAMLMAAIDAPIRNMEALCGSRLVREHQRDADHQRRIDGQNDNSEHFGNLLL
jgi:hypothetical protein